jgi:hypothetical protein
VALLLDDIALGPRTAATSASAASSKNPDASPAIALSIVFPVRTSTGCLIVASRSFGGPPSCRQAAS